MQSVAHLLARHAAVPLEVGCGHLLPQAPQLSTFAVVSRHCVPQSVDAGAVQPVTHWKVPLEFEQSGAAAVQALVQEPQVAGFERSVSQPSPGMLLQLAYPLRHAPRAHCPFVPQVDAALANAHGEHDVAAQPVAGSVVLTQAPLHSF